MRFQRVWTGLRKQHKRLRKSAACYTSHVTRHTSHVTRHTSHVTRHTSHVTRHTSHVTRHTSHVTGIPLSQTHRRRSHRRREIFRNVLELLRTSHMACAIPNPLKFDTHLSANWRTGVVRSSLSSSSDAAKVQSKNPFDKLTEVKEFSFNPGGTACWSCRRVSRCH
jgi:hypothetical protein